MNKAVFVPKNIYISPIQPKGMGLFAQNNFSIGDSIFKFSGILLSDNDSTCDALQIDENLYLESTDLYDNYLNHSCNPNCFIDFNTMSLVAIRDIKKDDELSFDYNTTEHNLIKSGCNFVCYCNEKGCRGEIKGFKYLSVSDKFSLKPLLSPYILKRFNEEIDTSLQNRQMHFLDSEIEY